MYFFCQNFFVEGPSFYNFSLYSFHTFPNFLDNGVRLLLYFEIVIFPLNLYCFESSTLSIPDVVVKVPCMLLPGAAFVSLTQNSHFRRTSLSVIVTLCYSVLTMPGRLQQIVVSFCQRVPNLLLHYTHILKSGSKELG